MTSCNDVVGKNHGNTLLRIYARTEMDAQEADVVMEDQPEDEQQAEGAMETGPSTNSQMSDDEEAPTMDVMLTRILTRIQSRSRCTLDQTR